MTLWPSHLTKSTPEPGAYPVWLRMIYNKKIVVINHIWYMIDGTFFDPFLKEQRKNQPRTCATMTSLPENGQ